MELDRGHDGDADDNSLTRSQNAAQRDAEVYVLKCLQCVLGGFRKRLLSHSAQWVPVSLILAIVHHPQNRVKHDNDDDHGLTKEENATQQNAEVHTVWLGGFCKCPPAGRSHCEQTCCCKPAFGQ
jgi:prenyltransferase beta subunit